MLEDHLSGDHRHIKYFNLFTISGKDKIGKINGVYDTFFINY